MNAGEIKRRLVDAEDELGAKPTRIMVVSHPPTAAQLEQQAKLEGEGFAVMFIKDPYTDTTQEPSP